MRGVDPDKVKKVYAREVQTFLQMNQKSLELHKRTLETMPNGVPNYWISYFPHPHPIFFKEGRGAHVIDVDGNERLDFCLGGSACLFGYGEPKVVEAVADQMARGSSPLLATEDAYYVGMGLKRAFGLPFWQVYVSATEANRNAIRISRMLTKREKILVYNGGYLGAVEDSFAVLANGRVALEPGVDANARDVGRMTRVVEFNNIEGVRQALADEQVACVIGEPAISNSGIILPRPGFHEALREATRRTGTLLVLDETQCIGAGYGGFSRTAGLKPDIMTMGKPMAGGIPVGLLGMSQEVADRVAKEILTSPAVNPGMGSTLAGSALQLRAIRAVLEHSMTEQNYELMLLRADALQAGMERAIQAHGVPWSVNRLGARMEVVEGASAPSGASESANRGQGSPTAACLHLYMLNRGVLLTVFGNTVIASPHVSQADTELHARVFADFLNEAV